MTGLPLILLFVLSIIGMIVAISRYKIHPFLVIMLISLFFGLIAGIPLVDKEINGVFHRGIAGVIGEGFSSAFTSIGIVIILGAIIGSVLEITGAALKFADMAIRFVGRKHPILAMELMGWTVSIAVFCDSGFVILNPIRKAIVKRTGASSVALSFGLAAGLFLSHCLIPPTPGPIAAANALGIGNNLLLVIGLGVFCSLFPAIAGIVFANFIGKRVKADDEMDTSATTQSYEELVKSYGKLPGGWNATAPVLIPILLMGISSVVSMMGCKGIWVDVLLFFGTPIMALAVGVVFAVIQLHKSGKISQFYDLTESTLKAVGPILFVTAAGSVLGKVLANTDIVCYIQQHADVLSSIGIFFPFILAALLKTALGSSSVSLITASGIVAPLLGVLGFDTPIRVALVCMAIGAGAMTVSHANDSYFWVVTNFGAMSPERGYKVQTLGTLVLGLATMVEVFLLTLVL